MLGSDPKLRVSTFGFMQEPRSTKSFWTRLNEKHRSHLHNIYLGLAEYLISNSEKRSARRFHQVMHPRNEWVDRQQITV